MLSRDIPRLLLERLVAMLVPLNCAVVSDFVVTPKVVINMHGTGSLHL